MVKCAALAKGAEFVLRLAHREPDTREPPLCPGDQKYVLFRDLGVYPYGPISWR
jgi:hypothetical protein